MEYRSTEKEDINASLITPTLQYSMIEIFKTL